MLHVQLQSLQLTLPFGLATLRTRLHPHLRTPRRGERQTRVQLRQPQPLLRLALPLRLQRGQRAPQLTLGLLQLHRLSLGRALKLPKRHFPIEAELTVFVLPAALPVA